MRLIIFLFVLAVSAFEPVNEATIYIDTAIGNIKYLPSGCKTHCPSVKPNCGVVKCHLSTSDGCSFTDFYNNVGNGAMTALYSVSPEIACDRETLLITKAGHYRVYIDSVTVFQNGLKPDVTYLMSVQNTLEPLSNNSIAITFTLGYNRDKNYV